MSKFEIDPWNKEFCPFCDDSVMKLITINEEIEIYDEIIKSYGTISKCTKCGETFHSCTTNVDIGEFAYLEYMRRHCMIHPRQLELFRLSIPLTTKDAAIYLDLDEDLYKRYENGGLHSVELDKKFKAWMEIED